MSDDNPVLRDAEEQRQRILNSRSPHEERALEEGRERQLEQDEDARKAKLDQLPRRAMAGLRLRAHRVRPRQRPRRAVGDGSGLPEPPTGQRQ